MIFLKNKAYIILVIILFIVSCASPNRKLGISFILDAPLAFPQADGFGSKTSHGRNGQIIEVTNLSDSGTGSLRDAVSKSGARIIVFNVSGTIQLTSHIKIDNPYIYIAGQSSPNGIQIKGAGIKIRTHDVLIRGLMIRPGNLSFGASLDDRTGIIIHNDKNSSQPYNIVIDHNSVQWGTDEGMSTYLPVHDITFSNNIIAEGLDCSGHPEGCHSMGLQIGGDALDISIVGNLLANNDWRNPIAYDNSRVEVINNVLYGWGTGSVIMQGSGNVKMNVIGNTYIPSRCSDPKGIYIDSANPGDKLYTDDWNSVSASSQELSLIRSDTPVFSGSVINIFSKDVSYENVLLFSGARNDSVDIRIKNNVKNRTLPASRCFIDSQSEVGGWANITDGKYLDTDKDGIPDSWELTNGLNPNLFSDGNALINGYTNVEIYLNSLILETDNNAVTQTPPPSTTATKTQTPFIITNTSTPSKTPTPIYTKTPTPTASSCVSGFTPTKTSVQINTYPKTINIRENHDIGARPIGYLYSDPGIRHSIVGFWTDCKNYWASIDDGHWFALKLNNVYYTDWRENK